MPPVRWKLLTLFISICAICTVRADTQKTDSITDDGWRPIMGQVDTQYHKEVTHYTNPTMQNEPVKAETPRPTTLATSAPIPPAQSPPPKPTTKNTPMKTSLGPNQSQNTPPNQYAGKGNSHMKQPNINNNGHNKPPQHGHHMPMPPSKGHRGLGFKHHQVPKMQIHLHPNGKRHNKPSRSHHREEVLSGAASSNIGSYAYFNQGPTGIKTRIIHSPTHADYNSNFGVHNPIYNNIPVQQQQFLYTHKHPIQNDVFYTFQNQNDEYTRNLVPPPPYKIYPEKEQKVKQYYKPKEPNNQPPQQDDPNKYKIAEKPVQIQQVPVVQYNHVYQNQQQVQNPHAGVDIQVTKEKLNVFHNNIPANYRPSEYQNHFVKATEPPKITTYEVTEGKYWHDNVNGNQQYSTRIPEFHLLELPFKNQNLQMFKKATTPKPVEIEPVQVHFLPTPYIPDLSAPTIPTQSEVSTIYNEISEINRHKPEPPGYFNIKEVSTHFPIIGKPQYHVPFVEHEPVKPIKKTNKAPASVQNVAYTDIQEDIEATTVPIPITDTPKPIRNNPARRRRPMPRPKTTEMPMDSIIGIVTEAYEAQKDAIMDITTRRPLRRRPTRLRTTEKPMEVAKVEPNNRKRQRLRVRPTHQTIEEEYNMPSNHKMQNSAEIQSTNEYYTKTNENYPVVQEPVPQDSIEDKYMESFQKIENDAKATGQINLYDLSNPYKKPVENFQEDIRQQTEEINTETVPTTGTFLETNSGNVEVINDNNGEKVFYYTTPSSAYAIEETSNAIPEVVPEVEVKEDNESTTLGTTTTSTTTSTTEAPVTTTKSFRVKTRQKYDTSRPRFSVKDYKQRFTSTTSTTTEKPQSLPHSPRVRVPNRFRKPVAPSSAPDSEETTEAARGRFKPNNARHRNQEKEEEVTTERPKSYSTRTRAFNRFRSTTEGPTTTQKISIKPNLFANRRRPANLSLKSRIAQKQKNAEETTTKAPLDLTTLDSKENEVTKEPPVDATFNTFESEESTTEINIEKISEDTQTAETMDKLLEEEPETETSKTDSFMYSQRVTDLTSAAQYDQPGLFKAVSPNTRRVPSYFTIATDDPILPIEAFFPNVNANNKA